MADGSAGGGLYHLCAFDAATEALDIYQLPVGVHLVHDAATSAGSSMGVSAGAFRGGSRRTALVAGLPQFVAMLASRGSRGHALAASPRRSRLLESCGNRCGQERYRSAAVSTPQTHELTEAWIREHATPGIVVLLGQGWLDLSQTHLCRAVCRISGLRWTRASSNSAAVTGSSCPSRSSAIPFFDSLASFSALTPTGHSAAISASTTRCTLCLI